MSPRTLENLQCRRQDLDEQLAKGESLGIQDASKQVPQCLPRGRGLDGPVAPVDDVPFLWLDTESNFHHLVRYVVHAGQCLKQAKPPVFNFVMIARNGAHRITIDNYVLHRPLKDLYLLIATRPPISAWRPTIGQRPLPSISCVANTGSSPRQ